MNLSNLSLVDSVNVEDESDWKSTTDDIPSSFNIANQGSCLELPSFEEKESVVTFVDYLNESQLPAVMSLVGQDLSEPYSIFTYRYFLYRFPHLCILAHDKNTHEPIGCVVGKIDHGEEQVDHYHVHSSDKAPNSTSISSSSLLPTTTAIGTTTGYIGMLAVCQSYRRKGIGSALVEKVIQRMKAMGCSSITLETEVTNLSAQRLYQERFGFIREELLVRYYLNWNDAYRLRLWL